MSTQQNSVAECAQWAAGNPECGVGFSYGLKEKWCDCVPVGVRFCDTAAGADFVSFHLNLQHRPTTMLYHSKFQVSSSQYKAMAMLDPNRPEFCAAWVATNPDCNNHMLYDSGTGKCVCLSSGAMYTEGYHTYDAYLLPAPTKSWVAKPVPTMAPTYAHRTFRQCQASLAQSIWCTNYDDEIYYFDGQIWKLIPGFLKQVAVSGDGVHVWGVNQADRIWRYNWQRETWDLDYWPHSRLKQIDVSFEGNKVWGTNAVDDIYVRNGWEGTWQHVPGKLKEVAVGGTNGGHVWGVNSNNDVYNFRDGTWHSVPDMKVEQISVGLDGFVVGMSGTTSYTRWGEHHPWKSLHAEASGTIFSTVNSDNVFKVQPDGGLFVYKDGRDWPHLVHA